MKHNITVFLATIIIITCRLTGVTASTNAYAGSSIWETATDVYKEDMNAIGELNIAPKAKEILAKIYTFEYNFVRGLFDISNEGIEYVTNRFFQENTLTIDVYSSIEVDCKDEIVAVQAEDDSVVTVEIIEGTNKVKIEGCASGQTAVFISTYDRTNCVNITVRKLSRSKETLNIAVGETRNIDITELTDLHISGYKASKKTIIKSTLNEPSQTLSFMARRPGNVKLYLTTNEGKTVRITIKVTEAQ